MIYFVAFTIIVLISGAIFMAKKSLKLAIGTPLAFFLAAVVWYIFTARGSQSVAAQAQLLFFLGTPMVFFASLLGPYLVEHYFNKESEDDQAS